MNSRGCVDAISHGISVRVSRSSPESVTLIDVGGS
jgi:hypothetical protein